MSVHYKFKAALEYSTITFDGIHITVADLKKEIIDQKHLKQNDFDLQIMNAQTEEVYEDDAALIPKNTSVIVARLPGISKRNSNGPGGVGPPFHQRQHHSRSNPASIKHPTAVGIDLTAMDATEEEKIKAMMKQSTDDYDPSKYIRIRGSGQHGRVPATYRCNKCKNEGHWIKDCPLQSEHSDIKKSTGIPRSSMVHVDSPDVPGAKMTPEGRYAVPAVDHAAYMEKNKIATKPPPPKPKIPDELVCTLCDDLMTDALMVSCCATSYCDECIRKALLDSDEQECPGCHEKEISPTSLIPNRFLRSQVNAFKNKTGYSKPQVTSESTKKDPPVVDLTEKKSEEPARRKLSLDELPEDLFPHSPRKVDPEIEQKEEEAGLSTNEEEKMDLYDFNDSSIPSPFASPRITESQENEQAIRTIGTVNNFYGNQQGHVPRHHHQQSHQPGHHHPPPHHNRPPKEPYRQSRTPLQSGMPPIPPAHHQPQAPRRQPPVTVGPPQDGHEPPPPGFGDMLPLPPGEDRIPTPTGRGRDDNMHRREEANLRRDRSDRDIGNPDGPSRGSLLPLPAIPPFNPTQPPPGFNPVQQSGSSQPKGPHGLPSTVYSGASLGSGPPPPLNIPSNQSFPPPYHSNYRLPPPGNAGHPPLFHQGGGPPMRGNFPREREREGRFGSRDRSMRKPAPRDHRSRDRDRPDEIRPGAIDDPLLEFERLMREKDRRKKLQQQQQQQPISKRSRSRSYSPARRSPTSPFVKRSRSRSFSRSPSPKRKRPAPLRRRKSYSRTPSRTPPRRHIRSRSRSRNRSLSPPPGPLSKRRSPRRAPPFSPSPPPSRFPSVRKDKEDFYDRSSRYESSQGGASRYYPPSGSASGSNSTKQYSTTGRDYNESSKYEISGITKFVDSQKYDQISTSGTGLAKFETRSGGSANRERDTLHHHSTAGPSSSSFRDRGRDIRERDRDLQRQVQYDFDPGIIPPGTESHIQQSNLTPVPSLFEIDIAPPASFAGKGSISNMVSHGDPFYSFHQHHQTQSRHLQTSVSQSQRERRSHVPSDKEGDLESLSVSLTPDSEIDTGPQKDFDSRKRHRKRSREGSSEKLEKKREKKEKKKHKRKKEKEEKKLKKNKKVKSDKASKDGSEDEHTTTTADETGPSRRSSVTEANLPLTSKELLGQDDQDCTNFEKPPTLSVETDKITHELDATNSNLTVIVCDSTVKSPERCSHGPVQTLRGKDIEVDPHKLESTFTAGLNIVDADLYDDIHFTRTVLNDTSQGIASTGDLNKDLLDPNFVDSNKCSQEVISRPGVVDQIGDINRSTSLHEGVIESTKEEEIPMVISKWDQFGEDDDPENSVEVAEGNTLIATKDSSTLDDGTGKISKITLSADKKVTSEVLKRAENAIFAKAISAISHSSSRSSSGVRRSSPPPPAASKRKVYLENVETEVPENDKPKFAEKGKVSDPDSKVQLGSGLSIKRSVRDRLGSKVSEEGSSMSRRDRSPLRERDKERQMKSQVGNAPSRDRDKERGRVRRRNSRSRSRSPRSKKDRSKSKDRVKDSERSRDKHRGGIYKSRSRSLKRSVSKSKRERPRRRSRSGSRTRNRNVNRKRSPLQLQRRSPSTSSHQGNRERLRESHSKSTPESNRLGRVRVPNRDSTHIKELMLEREPTPPGESTSLVPPVVNKTKKTDEEEAWKKQANKFVPIGGVEFEDVQHENMHTLQMNVANSPKEVDSAWKVTSLSGNNPIPLAVRKQKGRINIKLSSTTASKNEPGKSSSSSSDEDDHLKQESGGKDRSSGESDDSRRDDKKRRKDKKKTKRRRSDSSSTSSSDDSSRRKSKKSKKKKKKNKKKKKVK